MEKEKYQSSPEDKNKLPEGWVKETVGEMLGKLRGNPELQQKAFGTAFTDEELEARFPGNTISGDDLQKLVDALGYRPLTLEEVEAIYKAREDEERKDEGAK